LASFVNRATPYVCTFALILRWIWRIRLALAFDSDSFRLLSFQFMCIADGHRKVKVTSFWPLQPPARLVSINKPL
jgi:hypothetical protein